MSERRAKSRTSRKDVRAALSALQTQVDEQGRRIRVLEERLAAGEDGHPGAEELEACSRFRGACTIDLIGCLEDCVEDIEELRRKVRDVRSAGLDR